MKSVARTFFAINNTFIDTLRITNKKISKYVDKILEMDVTMGLNPAVIIRTHTY